MDNQCAPADCGKKGAACCPGNTCLDGSTVCAANACLGCGAAGQPCCAQNACAEPGTVCAKGSCANCGGAGQPCCAGDACNAAGTACAHGVCAACGASGQVCCAGNACNAPERCLNNVCGECGAAGGTCCPDFSCLAPGTTCVPPTCVVCGGLGQPCCGGANGVCTVGGVACVGGACTACGAAGQPCCAGPGQTSSCGPGNSCNCGVCGPLRGNPPSVTLPPSRTGRATLVAEARYQFLDALVRGLIDQQFPITNCQPGTSLASLAGCIGVGPVSPTNAGGAPPNSTIIVLDEEVRNGQRVNVMKLLFQIWVWDLATKQHVNLPGRQYTAKFVLTPSLVTPTTTRDPNDRHRLLLGNFDSGVVVDAGLDAVYRGIPLSGLVPLDGPNAACDLIDTKVMAALQAIAAKPATHQVVVIDSLLRDMHDNLAGALGYDPGAVNVNGLDLGTTNNQFVVGVDVTLQGIKYTPPAFDGQSGVLPLIPDADFAVALDSHLLDDVLQPAVLQMARSRLGSTPGLTISRIEWTTPPRSSNAPAIQVHVAGGYQLDACGSIGFDVTDTVRLQLCVGNDGGRHSGTLGYCTDPPNINPEIGFWQHVCIDTLSLVLASPIADAIRQQSFLAGTLIALIPGGSELVMDLALPIADGLGLLGHGSCTGVKAGVGYTPPDGGLPTKTLYPSSLSLGGGWLTVGGRSDLMGRNEAPSCSLCTPDQRAARGACQQCAAARGLAASCAVSPGGDPAACCANCSGNPCAPCSAAQLAAVRTCGGAPSPGCLITLGQACPSACDEDLCAPPLVPPPPPPGKRCPDARPSCDCMAPPLCATPAVCKAACKK